MGWATLAWAAPAGAQDYPTKPIRLIAPFAPGGATDVLARIAGQKMNERLGQPVVVENRTGAGGNIGAEPVVKAAADGYTLLMGGVPLAIALTAKARSPLLPSLPTVAEAGLTGFDVSSWYGVFGPAAVPRERVNKLNSEIGRGINTPELKDRLAALGAEPSTKSPEAFAQTVRDEIAKWAKVVKASGAKLD